MKVGGKAYEVHFKRIVAWEVMGMRIPALASAFRQKHREQNTERCISFQAIAQI